MRRYPMLRNVGYTKQLVVVARSYRVLEIVLFANLATLVMLVEEKAQALDAAQHASANNAERTLLSDENAFRREAAALVLGRNKRSSAVAVLSQVLRTDRNAWVRAACAKALGEIGETSALPTLKAALSREKRSAVRRATAQSLVLLGDRHGLDELLWQMKSGLNHDKAAVTSFLTRFTGMAYGQDVAAWWSFFAKNGSRIFPAKNVGSPAIYSLTAPSGSWITGSSLPLWRKSCATIVRLPQKATAFSRTSFQHYEQVHGPIPDNCFVLLTVDKPPKGTARSDKSHHAALTNDGVDFLLQRAKLLEGIGLAVDGEGKPLVSLDQSVRNKLVKRHKAIIEGLFFADKGRSSQFPVLMVKLGSSDLAKPIVRQPVAMFAVEP